jgi:hypothetical protein
MEPNQPYFTLPAMSFSSGQNPTPYQGSYNTGNFTEDYNNFWKDKSHFELPTKAGDMATDTTSSFWSNSGSLAKEWGSNVWDWANTETGSSVIGGAIGGAAQMYAQGKQEDLANKLSGDRMSLAQMQIEAEMAMQEAALAQEMELAMMKENRINAHNASINNPNTKMNVRKFQ